MTRTCAPCLLFAGLLAAGGCDNRSPVPPDINTPPTVAAVVKKSATLALKKQTPGKVELSEDRRKEVFAAIYANNEAATKQAERQIPLPDTLSPGYKNALVKQSDLRAKIGDQLDSATRKKYDIGKTQWDAIEAEGSNKEWVVSPSN